MAKIGSFLRRFFNSHSADDQNSSSTSEPQCNIILIPPSSPTNVITSKPTTLATRSCTVSPQLSPQPIIKQTVDKINTTSNSNFLSSDINKSNVRRLSAPLLIQTFTTQQSQYSSTIVNEITEQALIASLHRLSISSVPAATLYHKSSNPSLGNTCISNTPTHPLSRPEEMEIYTPPLQSIVGPQSSSTRASIQSNNSPVHNSVMKDTSPTSESIIYNHSDRKMSLPARGRRPSMFDPIDPKELQQALYASAAAKASIPSKAEDEIDSTRALSYIKLIYDREGEHVFIDSLSFENMHMLDTFANSTSNINSPSANNTNTNGNNNNNNNNDLIPFYCRFRLCPERRSLFQTNIIRHPRSQSFHIFDLKELHDMNISSDQLSNHSIEMILYKVGTNKPTYKDIRIASVKYDLEGLIESDEVSIKKPLDESDPSSIIQDPDLGNLLVSLSYLQSAAKLAVVVLEAKSLRPLSIESKPFPEACVKVTLYDRNGKKLKRKKTSVQKASDCPTFNEELVFELRRDIAQEIMIELRIVHESLSYKEQLGSITFGPAIVNMTKGYMTQENAYWSMILSGESLNAQWQILKLPTKIEESK
ncbi:hypothetical protein I4U23_010043 [Adineta vaga]|nr:hypothetical protein I4U23_010043 [Adineta vaga]